MATILFAWKLGAGLGHLGPLRQFTKELASRDHRVVAVARDIHLAKDKLDSTLFECIQASFANGKTLVESPLGFADILLNNGFESAETGANHVEAWRRIYKETRPDLVVAEHSPTALVAARSLDAKCAVMGTGFTIPPSCDRLPLLRPWQKVN